VKLVHWLVTAPLAVVLVVFAVANRDVVSLSFWPLPIELRAPVWAVVLLTLLAGFLIGEFVAWINGRRWRRRARDQARRVETLERELAAKTPPKEPTKELSRT
jgi:lipopolysaccharide assembly protein A